MHARAGAGGQLEHACLNLQTREGIVEQAIELAQLARIVDTGQRASEVERLRRQKPAADGGAEAMSDLRGLA